MTTSQKGKETKLELLINNKRAVYKIQPSF